MGVNKLKKIEMALNNYFYEREEIIEGLILSLLAKQNVFLYGTASTGKTALSEAFINIVEGEQPFSMLVGGFTTPEELFGGVKMEEYMQGIVTRNIEGKLPDVRLAFIDEFFKANPVFLNTLLGLLHETERRFFDDGVKGGVLKTPLNMVITASNELPEEDDGLYPLYDRFGFRFFVKELRNPENRKKARLNKVMGAEQPVVPTITPEELEELQLLVKFVDVSRINEVLEEINIKLRDEGIYPTPRRLEASLKLLQARAIYNEKPEPEEKDLIIVQNTLWDDPDDIEIVQEIVKEFAQDRVQSQLERILEEAKDIFETSVNGDKDTIFEASAKIKELTNEINLLLKKFPDRAEEINKTKKIIEGASTKLVRKTLFAIDGEEETDHHNWDSVIGVFEMKG